MCPCRFTMDFNVKLTIDTDASAKGWYKGQITCAEDLDTLLAEDVFMHHPLGAVITKIEVTKCQE